MFLFSSLHNTAFPTGEGTWQPSGWRSLGGNFSLYRASCTHRVLPLPSATTFLPSEGPLFLGLCWYLPRPRPPPHHISVSQCYSTWLSFASPHKEWASLVAQLVKNPPAVQETCFRSLDWEDPLEKGTPPHSSILAWRIPWTVWSMRSLRVRHNWATFTFFP